MTPKPSVIICSHYSWRALKIRCCYIWPIMEKTKNKTTSQIVVAARSLSGARGAASDGGAAGLTAGRASGRPFVPAEEEVQRLPGGGPEPAGRGAGGSAGGHRPTGQQQPLARSHWRSVQGELVFCVSLRRREVCRRSFFPRHTGWIETSPQIICQTGRAPSGAPNFTFCLTSQRTERWSRELLWCHGCRNVFRLPGDGCLSSPGPSP